MDNNIVILENDVVENVFRPISAFLNSIEDNTILTFVDTYETTNLAGKVRRMYKYLGSNGVLYNFSEYDFGHFLTNGVPITDIFKLDYDKDVRLRLTFTVLNAKPRLTKSGKRIYPLFAYTGYDSFKKQEALREKHERPQLLQELFTTDIIEEQKERYSRLINIDEDIMYYA